MSFIHYRRKSSQKPININLRLKIKNFGPISKGALNLKPLTIFVGPNNSGKSYAAMLIHSILSSYDQLTSQPVAYRRKQYFSTIYKSYYKELQAITKQNKGAESFCIPVSLSKKVIRGVTKDYGNILESTINRHFGSEVSGLVRTKQKSARITVSNSNTFDIIMDKNLSITSNITGGFKYKIQFSKREPDSISEETHGERSFVINIDKNIANEFLKFDFGAWLLDSITRNVRQPNIPDDSYYFPAARSGILQGHKALSASIVQSAPFAGIRSFQIPKLTGIVSDFISNIILIPDRRGPFFDLASELESEMLHGHIKLLSPAKGTFPEITYNSKNYEIQLHRTSSTISEIAPLSLYLKYIVYPSSMLIIEEPEAHLHPTNQLIFAKYIVRMIRAGLNVLITTHSVFLLEQLGKYMLAGKLKPEIRTRELNFGPDDYLLPEEVSPYVFVRQKDDEHVISDIETNDEDGISQEEFVKVNEALHSESIKLQENLPES